MPTDDETVLAVDVGGTKFAAALVDRQGRVRVGDRVAVPGEAGAETAFAALEGVCRAVVGAAKIPPSAIGVGSFGPMEYPAGIISPVNLPAWRRFPLRDRLGRAFELPCVVDNDAKAVAVGEHWLGAGRGRANMLGMVVSTGVGGGIILDGRLLHGQRGNAGHIGHLVVWPNGPVCRCGAAGCVEAVGSGTGIAARAALALDAGATTTIPRGATAVEIAAAARAGDRLARQLFDDAGSAVGQGIAAATTLLDLDLVAIGGGVATHAWDLLGPPLESAVRLHAGLEFARKVQVVQCQLGDQAGLLGAARLAWDLIEARGTL